MNRSASIDDSVAVAAAEPLSASASRPWRRREPIFPPSLIMIGASTGGPQALLELLGHLGPALPYVAVCITLHMPPDLVPVIAAQVTRTCRIPTHVVTERSPLKYGRAHFASGRRYIAFARSGMSFDVAPAIGAPGDFCKPAIDTMFTSGAAAHGSRALGVVLSGMGTDGLIGARAIVAAGGLVLVQDKESSAVWGMPGAVAKANLATSILAPSAIAEDIVRRVRIRDVPR